MNLNQCLTRIRLNFIYESDWNTLAYSKQKNEETEPSFLENYKESISQKTDGRCVACLPWKDNWHKLKTNKRVAEMRLEHLLKKLAADPATWQLYHEQFQEYIRKGYVAEADPNFTGTHTYLPHRHVLRAEATSTKCCPVFDGSPHPKRSTSINNVLEVGPNLNPQLLAVFLRFRLNKVA